MQEAFLTDFFGLNQVWSLSSGACLHILSGHTSTVRCVRMVGQHIVSGSRDMTVSSGNSFGFF
jgi:WD40 repeat protein